MRHTFAGLGASRAEVMAKFKRTWARNEFATNIGKRTKNYYDMADGMFLWNDEKVYFDFYGQGKLRTITILWSEIQASAQLEGETFAPDTTGSNRWVGKLTEFAGGAHRLAQTTMWERAAWNTVNTWCASRNAGRGYSYGAPTITQLRDTAAKAYARITLDYSVHYFIPHEMYPEDRPIHFKRGAMEGNSYWMTTFLRHFPTHGEPSWQVPTNLTPDQEAYINIAWDAFEESGRKPSAPLMGLKLLKTCVEKEG